LPEARSPSDPGRCRLVGSRGRASTAGAAGAGGGTGEDPAGGAAGAEEVGPPPPALELPPEPKTAALAWLREITSTVLAVAIVMISLTLLSRTFAVAGDFQSKKDVMLYGLTILGTVVGYYFGRVPAERRAEASEETAKKAHNAASDATAAAAQAQQRATRIAQDKEEVAKKLVAAKSGVEKVKAALAPAAGAQRKGFVDGLSEPGAPAAEAFLELEVLSRLL
jgi:hypothetical protein